MLVFAERKNLVMNLMIILRGVKSNDETKKKRDMRYVSRTLSGGGKKKKKTGKIL